VCLKEGRENATTTKREIELTRGLPNRLSKGKFQDPGKSEVRLQGCLRGRLNRSGSEEIRGQRTNEGEEGERKRVKVSKDVL